MASVVLASWICIPWDVTASSSTSAMLDPLPLNQNPSFLTSAVNVLCTVSFSASNPLANLMNTYPLDTGLKSGTL